ncbi:MAG: hypothetical protein AABX23_01625 [Nanoarchaeota archaeon]
MDGLVKKIGKTGLYVVDGDITKIPADALITAINSGGMWFGGIDGAIQRVAGDHYHSQASKAMPLQNLQTIIAKGGARPDRKIGFRDVVFVVDDLRSPLDEVVYAGLEAAHSQNYGKILIPTIRMGVMAGVVEKTPQEAISKLGAGIGRFMDQYGAKTKMNNLTFVVYGDVATAMKLRSGLSSN